MTEEHWVNDVHSRLNPTPVTQILTPDSVAMVKDIIKSAKDAGRILSIAEGLLMYLEPERAARVFQEAYKASGLGSRFVFTFLEPQTDGRVGFARPSRFVDGWLRRRAEPFRWGLSQENMASFLNRHGWRLLETLLPSALRRRYLAEELPLAIVGDVIGLADWKAE
jgi:O-methyltransferase involved in polyketide biosynthesis